MASQRNVPVDQQEKKNAPSGDIHWQNSASETLSFSVLTRLDESEILKSLSECPLFFFYFRGNQAFWPFVFWPDGRRKYSPLKLCLSEFLPLENCFLEFCLLEPCPLEICPLEICFMEKRLSEICASEPCPLELRPYEICIGEVDLARMTGEIYQSYLLKVWHPVSVMLPNLVFGRSEVREGAQSGDHVTCAGVGIIHFGFMVWHEREGRWFIFLLLFFRLSGCVAHEAAEQILHGKIVPLRVGHGQLTQRENSGFAHRQALVGQHRCSFRKPVGILSLLSDENLLLRHGRTPDGQRQTDQSEQKKSEIAKMGNVIGVLKIPFDVPARGGDKTPNIIPKEPKENGKIQDCHRRKLRCGKSIIEPRYTPYCWPYCWIEPCTGKLKNTFVQFLFLDGQECHRNRTNVPRSFQPSLDFASHVDPFRGKTLQYSSFTSGCEGSAMTLLIDPSKKPTRYRSNEACVKHFCMAKGCSNWGAFGIGASFKAGKPGQWFCSEHIAQAHKQLCSETRKSSDIPDYLLPQPVRARKARRERNFKKQQGVLL